MSRAKLVTMLYLWRTASWSIGLCTKRIDDLYIPAMTMKLYRCIWWSVVEWKWNASTNAGVPDLNLLLVLCRSRHSKCTLSITPTTSKAGCRTYHLPLLCESNPSPVLGGRELESTHSVNCGIAPCKAASCLKPDNISFKFPQHLCQTLPTFTRVVRGQPIPNTRTADTRPM
jgi:hypothetical protein